LWIGRGADTAERPASAPVAAPTTQQLPSPPASLLSAQADLTRGGSKAFDAEMRGYREQLLRALEQQYPASIGRLQQPGRQR
jgi:hypothetical protein